MSPNITRKQALAIARDATLEGRPGDARRIMAEFPRRWNAAPHSCHHHESQGLVCNSGIDLRGGTHSYQHQVTMINPTSREQNRYHPQHAYVLSFGAYGSTHLHVFASSLDDALEECAAWLADHAPGHIMASGSDEHTELCKEAFEDAGLTWTGDIDWADSAQEEAIQSAEADLTYTESGYLTSHEWGISLEDPDLDTLYAFVTGE